MTVLSKLLKRNKAPLVLLVLLAFSFTFLLPGHVWAATIVSVTAAVTEQDDISNDFRLTLGDDRFLTATPAKNLALGGDFNNGTVTGTINVRELALEGDKVATATLNLNQAQAEFAGGSGTQDDPYLIADAHQLNNVRKYPDAHFQLQDNIDLAVAPFNQDKGWEPIGTPASPFNGIFDGNGKVIKGLYINRGDEDYVGLFGYIGGTAVIQNVSLEDVSVTGRDKVGGLVGTNNGLVMNCYATVAITGNNSVGGLVGENSVHVSGSYAAGNVTGNNYVGGLVGYNAVAAADSYATAVVSGNNYVGGLVGYNEWSVTEAYAAGKVDGKKYVGGLAGYSKGEVRYCHATGAVTGNEEVGGLVGFNEGNVYDSYYDRYTTGQSDTGKGEPKTTGEMQLRSTYAGWDFLYIWGIEDGSGYPVLRWQAGAPLSGFDAAASVWSAEVGVEFHLNITGARGADDNYLGGSKEVTVYSDLQNEKVFQSAVEFEYGELVAPVAISLSTIGTHKLRVFVEGVSYSNLVTVEVVPPLVFAGGSGSPDDPYLIADADQLNNVRHRLNAHYKLTSDINLEGRGWSPIGTSENFPFQGGFNGNGHVIRNLTIDWTSFDYAGFFGYARDAVFRKIYLENVNVSGNEHVGGLVGYMKAGSIEACTLSGRVKGIRCVGGLAGTNEGSKISGSHAAADVEGEFHVGGLVGENNGGILSGVFTDGKVSGSIGSVGGLVGSDFDGKISGSHTAAGVEGEFMAGGLVGYTLNSKISGSCASSDVKGELHVGGLVGYSKDSEISSSYAAANVKGDSEVGGLVGANYFGKISACYTGEDGKVTGNSKVGGLAGVFANGEIANSYSRAGVTGSCEVGGLVGTAGEENPHFQTKLVKCYAAGAVLGDSSTGGLAGTCLRNGSITGCYYDSEVSGCSGQCNQWGKPKTTTEMKRQDTFAGWDFDTVWGIVEEHTYPYLQWQDQAGFKVALAQAGDKTAGNAFELSITGAIDVSGSYLDGDFNLIVTSDREVGEVYNGPVTFAKGNAAVQVTLTALGKHILTVTVAGASGS
ncbi:MAG: GLUG motif-containing protein [Peptococcaceae bacterium MAG4]|nr:GLUG motif-containing protein [Peptococcaceae bacterium MAG4]